MNKEYIAEEHKLSNEPHPEFQRNDTFIVVEDDIGMKTVRGELLLLCVNDGTSMPMFLDKKNHTAFWNWTWLAPTEETWNRINHKPESDGQAEQHLGAVTESYWDEVTEWTPEAAKKWREYIEKNPRKVKCAKWALGEWGKEKKSSATEVWWDEMEDTLKDSKPNCEQKYKTKRDSKVHKIKCAEPFFTDIDKELKTFELRKNDRDYRRHDFLELMQYVDGKETGKHIYAYVEYLLEGYEGIQPGYCIMGIERIMSNTFRDKKARE